MNKLIVYGDQLIASPGQYNHFNVQPEEHWWELLAQELKVEPTILEHPLNSVGISPLYYASTILKNDIGSNFFISVMPSSNRSLHWDVTGPIHNITDSLGPHITQEYCEWQSNFTYDNELENIITSKFFINIVDNKKFLIDRYPIINQPIYKILSEEIDLKETFEILSIKIINNEIAINLVSKNNSPNSKAKIKLTFNGDDYSLKNWEIVDDLGQSTYLEFTKIRKNISIDQELFVIKQ